MKILFISDVYFPRVSGVSNSIRVLVEQLTIVGHQVDLIAPDYGKLNSDEGFVTPVPARGLYFNPKDKLIKVKEAFKLLPVLQREQYDVIHIHTPFAAHQLGVKLAVKLDIPCVEMHHTLYGDYLHYYLPWVPQSIVKPLGRFISKRQCNAVDALVLPSHLMLNALRKLGVVAPAEVVPTGVLENDFESDVAYAKRMSTLYENIVKYYKSKLTVSLRPKKLIDINKKKAKYGVRHALQQYR